MNRNVTAVYRTFATADLVRRELQELGLSDRHIHVIPDADSPVGTSGAREDRRWTDRLHDLHLPDDDVRTYQHCVRRGDYVVSANVDDGQIHRALMIMRRPEAEAYDLTARDAEFRDESVYAHSDPSRSVPEAGMMGRRDRDNADPYVRSYRRDRPYST